ncbi:MAG: hypothetical protein HY473_01000 [Candidatus Sungbacteria bacterium]|uniref:Uncharacterized protein n=1 Tax=Candidatus Sungiibacteriota bacterium TaxID=2750080 RepID=A0A932YXH2_9BACT|nr:hypothetical protein [Candidatus Sungbacteria bacterium]
MRKKILLGLGAAGTALAMLPLFAAFEAHVINVTATIENALQLRTTEIEYGTVFPEEKLDAPLVLALSSSFLAEDRVDDVEYVIRQKPKCGLPDPGTDPVQYSAFGRVTEVEGQFVCEDQGHVILPLLCPYLSKHPDGNPTPGNDGSLDAFHGPITGWSPEDTVENQVLGKLSKVAQDIADEWNIDLVVPCFKGSCAQDNVIPPQYQADPANEHEIFGCDLWVEVTGVSLPPPPPGTVTVTKVIADVTGTTLVVADFNLFVGAEAVASGVGESFAPGSYVVSETEAGIVDETYSTAISCDDDDFVVATGTITVESGEVISCTITNTEIPQ